MKGSDRMYPWGDGRRFYSHTRYLRSRFGGRLQKVALDAGFGCPHRADSRGEGGCIYCNNRAFTPNYCLPALSVSEQLQEGTRFHGVRYRRNVGYLAYFQSYSNTYASVDRLEGLYREALAFPGVCGLVIATRPDCLPQGVQRLLGTLAQTSAIFVELGIESLHDETLRIIRRGHDASCSRQAIRALKALDGVHVGTHVILGLPGETQDEMESTVSELCALGIDSVKFHQLQVVQGTALAQMYRADPSFVKLLGREEYLELMVELLGLLPAGVSVDRICAEVPPRYLIGPNWGGDRYDVILREFEGLLEARDRWQGDRLGVAPIPL